MTNITPGRFDGRTALVAGGAGGIGTAICNRIAAEGGRVVCADLSLRRAGDVARRIVAAGGVAEPMELDAGDAESWRKAVSATPGLDILITAIYSGAAGAVDTLNAEEWDDSFRATSRGVFLGMSEACQVMPAGGAIVNIASVIAHGGAPLNIAYSSAKAAVIAMSRSAANRLAPRGIRVNVVTPGFIETRALAGNMEALAREGRTADDVRASYVRRVPLGRVGAPGEVAAAVAFLASEDAAYVTGAELVVDGGYRTQ